MTFKSMTLLFLFLSLSGCAFSYPSPFLLWNDFKANRLVKSEKYEEALEEYYKMIESNPDWAGAHSNIGVILNQNKKNEDAIKSLVYAQELAEKAGDLKSLFAIQYNLGVLFGSEKKYQQAIDHYQEALKLVPASIETKTNIELLLQQQKQEQEQKQKEEQEQKQKEEQEQNKQEEDQKKDQQQDQSGSGQGDDQKDNPEQKDQQDKKDGDQNKDQDTKDQNNQEQEEEKPKDVKNSPKYQPRPYKGEQLSEGDVKKILGELRNQEQKIRANFDKKEREKDNDKDW